MVSCWSIAKIMMVVSPSTLRAGGFVTAPTDALSNRWQGLTLSRARLSHRSDLPERRMCRLSESVASEDDGAAVTGVVVNQVVDLSTLQNLGGAVEDNQNPQPPVVASTPALSAPPSEAAPVAAAATATTAVEGEMEDLVVAQEDDNAPIDWILSRRMPVNSRRYYRQEIEGGGVKLNGKTVTQLVRVPGGSTISVKKGTSDGSATTGGGDKQQKNLLFPQRLPDLKVLFEDDHFVAVQKPPGMVCQPCEAAKRGTVLHGLLHHYVESGQVKEGDLAAARTLSQGIVHRLDKHTSGVMVVAKTLEASSKFNELFKLNKVRKEYLVICHGDPGRDSVVDEPLYRRSSGKVAAVSKDRAQRFGARPASTRIQNIASIGGLSLCKAEIITGRMHQVRVHLQWKGCPIVGDKEYGDAEANYRVARRQLHRVAAKRPLLHSMTLEFVHPFTNKPMSFKAAMPNDMWEPASHILRVSGTPEQKEEFEKLQQLRLLTPADVAAVEAKAMQDGRRAAAAARVKRLSRGQGKGGTAAARAASAAVSALGRGER